MEIKIFNVDVLITSSIKVVNVNEQFNGQDRNSSLNCAPMLHRLDSSINEHYALMLLAGLHHRSPGSIPPLQWSTTILTSAS